MNGTGAVVRVVSIVPSLTEALAATAPQLLVGATDWCSHPPDLDVVRIGGTKNPDVPRIVELGPDLVVANEEENRAPDLEALRAAGIAVHVTEVRTLDGAFSALSAMLGACGLDRPAWLDEAQRAWDALPVPARRSAGGDPDLAPALDGRRPGHVHRFGAGPARRGQRARRRRAALPAHRPRRAAPSTIWSCCPTSRTGSPPTTGRRPSPQPGRCWSAAGC